MPQPITIEAFVNAAPDEAWAAYTSPDAVMAWNQASPEWHCPSAAIDLRPEGRHVVRMEARDGSIGFDFGGTYEEVEAPNMLTLRLDDGRRTTTTFVAEGTGTRVTTVFEPESSNLVEMQRAGWQAILDSYAAFVHRPR